MTMIVFDILAVVNWIASVIMLSVAVKRMKQATCDLETAQGLLRKLNNGN